VKITILAGLAIAALMLPLPSKAQPVIEDPAYCANFYPNANCQNYGPGNPYTGDYWSVPGRQPNGFQAGGWQRPFARYQHPPRYHHRRHRQNG
jgi:hypothetical protein